MITAEREDLTWTKSDGMERCAVISACGLFRYVLGRRWGTGPAFVSISANPSKADALIDDPTIRRDIGFAKREGCGVLFKLNIGAFRATDPDDWMSAHDPVGPENDAYLTRFVRPTDIVVAAWGTLGKFRSLGSHVKWLLRERPLLCFGVSKDGYPRHPLYLRNDTALEPYNDCARQALAAKGSQ